MTAKHAARCVVHRGLWEGSGVEYGFCLCGCGERTAVATRTVMSACLVKGEPYRFLPNHHTRLVRLSQRSRVDPNPSGVCVCGCGEAVAPFPSERHVVIHPRFAVGHRAGRSPVDWVEEDWGFESPCWIWRRKITKRGYGILEAAFDRPRAVMAHRWVFEQEGGVIPPEHELHHRCEVRACVNPAHLVPLTEPEHKALHRELRHAAC